MDDGTELVERLAAVGLDAREAKLYVDLLAHGASRASDAAARVRLKRTETYRALESLMERGLITGRLTRPVQYEALPPETVFQDLLARHEQQRHEIESLQDRVAELAARGREKRATEEGRYGYRIIQGRRASLSTVETMVRSARKGIEMATPRLSPALVTPSNRAFHAMARRVSEGLPLRLLVRDHPQFDRLLQPLRAHAEARVRFADLPPGSRFVIVDNKEIVFWLVSDPVASLDAREDVAMWTNAPDFIHAQRTYFETLWESARDTLRAPPA